MSSNTTTSGRSRSTCSLLRLRRAAVPRHAHRGRRAWTWPCSRWRPRGPSSSGPTYSVRPQTSPRAARSGSWARRRAARAPTRPVGSRAGSWRAETLVVEGLSLAQGSSGAPLISRRWHRRDDRPERLAGCGSPSLSTRLLRAFRAMGDRCRPHPPGIRADRRAGAHRPRGSGCGWERPCGSGRRTAWARPLPSDRVTWRSRDPETATVGADGVVVGRATGPVTITGTANRREVEVHLTVDPGRRCDTGDRASPGSVPVRGRDAPARGGGHRLPRRDGRRRRDLDQQRRDRGHGRRRG